jgi:vancomycin resistance protein YoaR
MAQAAHEAFLFGHHGPWYQQARERLSGFVGRRHEFGRLTMNTDVLGQLLHKKLMAQEKPAQDAGLAITDANVSVTPSVVGASFDYFGALHQAHAHLLRLNVNPIAVRSLTIQPRVPNNPQLSSLASAQVPDILTAAPLTVIYGEKTWTIDRTALMTLLGWQKTSTSYVVTFDTAKTFSWLEKIKPEVETTAQNAKFAVVGGKVSEFQASAAGRTIDLNATLVAMRAGLVAEPKQNIALVVIEKKPITDTSTTNDLGITELVAEGKTNFHGSPTNRRYNLTFGTNKLNGLLIAPGETFSLVTALGHIDQKNGWKSELVIKGTDITPEFGGGLCQVATTLFRAVLNAGLPVVERHNHSLRIRYYEPPVGLDATIYEPKPDLRFTNDYQHYLLLQTAVDGDNLIYDFFGTKDGRTVDIPDPKVYNRTAIPATVNIIVDDLKPGEKVCQTPGHPGADATATYTVTKADGTKVRQIFQSHYRPLPVICHIGKEKAKPKSTNTNSAANTNTSVNTNSI